MVQLRAENEDKDVASEQDKRFTPEWPKEKAKVLKRIKREARKKLKEAER